MPTLKCKHSQGFDMVRAVIVDAKGKSSVKVQHVCKTCGKVLTGPEVYAVMQAIQKGRGRAR